MPFKFYLIHDNYEADNVQLFPISIEQFYTLFGSTMKTGVLTFTKMVDNQLTFGFNGGSGVSFDFSNDPSAAIYQPPPDKKLKY